MPNRLASELTAVHGFACRLVVVNLTDQLALRFTEGSRQVPVVSDRAMGEAAAVLRNAKRGLRLASGQRKARLHQAINHLNTLVGRTRQVVAQARSRLAGVMPESATRLVSLHDADARPIRKGRLGKPVEFGYKAQVVDNADGVILDHSVEVGNPADAPQLAPAIERITRRVGRYRQRLLQTAATVRHQ